MIYNDTVGIKLKSTESLAQSVKIIRKYIPLSISDIQNRIGSESFLFSCECTDEKGLGLIIKLYNQLTKTGSVLDVYDGDNISSIDIIKNMKGSVKETRLSFGDLDDDEI